MDWFIPKISGDQLEISIEVGEQLFMVGANGSGKTALIQNFVTSQPNDKVRRISAHRQAWFQSGSLDFTAYSRKQFEQNNMNWDRQANARWMDHSPREKQSAVLFDLVAKENTRSRNIARHIDEQNPEEAIVLASNSVSPFKQLNDLLELGTLTVSIKNFNDEEILAQRRNNGLSFSIAQMSDGERAAVIIAANVLTVEPGTVLLIDEPERHLHRSIIEPFLSALFAQRKDCAFVISTHEIALPIANPKARVLMVRSCEWTGDTAKAWELEVLESNTDLPEDLKLDILGSRRRVLFLEGTTKSLDLPLYSTLFPDLSVIPKGSCNDVIRAVKGLWGSREFHHVEAFGLIDRDDRPEDEIEKLSEDNVFVLDVCSAEALYYCSDAIAAVARRQAESLDRDPDEMIETAQKSAMKVIQEIGLAKRMSAKRCERQVYNVIQSLAPDWRQIKKSGRQLHIPTVNSPYADELTLFQKFAAAKNLDGLIARYPLRESSVFIRIAEALECNTRKNYERMVVSRVREDEDLARKLKQRIEPLSNLLNTKQKNAS
ncbi:MAG: AAA family ATPase [Candidatus Poribacteria bacterium]|nr:AAA family ATPase [Candidatus Poribacteria bacterium]